MLAKLLQQRSFRFLLVGIVGTVFNLGLIYLLVNALAMNTPLQRNLANVVAIELGLLLCFWLNRQWVWQGAQSGRLLKQLSLYHLASGAAVLTRILLIFPVLDWLGMNYLLNTLMGIGLAAVLNYFLCDRYVFE